MEDERKRQKLAEDEKKICETISKIKHRVAVFSGKGGVGKSTVSVNLAYGFSQKSFLSGILDADITGPNIPKMLGLNEEIIIIDERIIPFEKFGLKIVSMASIVAKGQPVLWRGPMRSKAISQFLKDVEWNELDLLIADLPPGTGDEILTISQEMKPDYAVIVTTPQDVSVIDAERAINMAKHLNIPNIGVIENMSGFVCPRCSAIINIFGEGGGEKLAYENGVKFLGAIPIDINARILGDAGKPAYMELPESELKKSFDKIIQNIESHYLNGLNN